ncbi:hypothetical protein [Blastococcus sp. CCUG 61487]|uniref:hypothetical protein n=1 Tax=Blastococcus sp. CCUG 61487 TaxID=1840703 RepID=UPI0010C15191|nr:hypothetical protein [Blastococcus sp. CCUG 61487]TKJ30444.1 hypothetical protein A6V29_01885 [Blastococcus sp. CCUG 61487]
MTTGADWLDSARRLLDALRPAAEPVPDPGTGTTADGHGTDCRWCPVCQAAAVLRGERPEVTAALADVLTTTAAALRDLADEVAQPAPAPAEDGTRPDDEGPDPRPVQRIDIA